LKIRHWQTFDRETSPKSGFFERKTEFQNTLLSVGLSLPITLESVLKIRHWQTFDRETSPKSGFFERKTEF
jgi:hypothetical protein